MFTLNVVLFLSMVDVNKYNCIDFGVSSNVNIEGLRPCQEYFIYCLVEEAKISTFEER